jgi:hypothetical protein
LFLKLEIYKINKIKKKLFNVILKPIVGDDLLRERLEIDTLENLKLIQKKEAFNQKYVKIKTRLL